MDEYYIQLLSVELRLFLSANQRFKMVQSISNVRRGTCSI